MVELEIGHKFLWSLQPFLVWARIVGIDLRCCDPSNRTFTKLAFIYSLVWFVINTGPWIQISVSDPSHIFKDYFVANSTILYVDTYNNMFRSCGINLWVFVLGNGFHCGKQSLILRRRFTSA